jgi:pimeloyl-ACP methyl ester carboxylesterase
MSPNPDDYDILCFQKQDIPEAHMNANLRRNFETTFQRRDHDKAGNAPVLTLAERNANPILTVESTEADGLPVLSDAELDDYCAAYSRNGFFGPISWYRNIDRNAELLPQVGQTPLDLPVLQIEVPEDAFVPANAGDITRALCSDAEVVTITQSGHWTMLEQPEALTSAILDWLERKHKTSDPV